MKPLWRGIWHYLAKWYMQLPSDLTTSLLDSIPKIYLEKHKPTYVQGYSLWHLTATSKEHQHGTGWKWPNISVEQNRGPRSKSIYSQLVYNRGGKKLCWRKDSIFDKWCWEIWMATFLKMGLEHFLTPYTNINSK